ncbi:MAG: hypothetical protein AAFX87_11165 [Bacteroidota bacterium]
MKFLVDILFASNNKVSVQVKINQGLSVPVNGDSPSGGSQIMYNQATSSGDNSGDDTEGDPIIQTKSD